MKKVTAMLFTMAVGLNVVSMAAKAKAAEEQETDVLLIGGGIMSATLGTYLQELEPQWSMTMVERLDGVAQESSNGWNNAGTGHSALAGNLEGFVNVDCLFNADATVGLFRRVVQLHQCGVSRSGVIPAI